MAAITTTAIGAGIAGVQTVSGILAKKEAEDKLNNYDRQALSNAFENVQISTVGSDLIKEQNNVIASGAIDASRNGGMRGIFGTLPKIQEATNSANSEIRKELDDQVNRRSYAIAGDNTRIRDIQENRDNNNIAGLSSQVDAGKQDTMNGILGFGKSIMYGANNIDFDGKGSQVDKDQLKLSKGFNTGNYPVPSFSFKPSYENLSESMKSSGLPNENQIYPDEFMKKPNNFFNF